MLSILLLWIIVPIAIFFSLVVFNNVILTFILFYGVICLLIPIVDLFIIQKKNIKEYLQYLGFKNFKKTIIPSTIIGIIFSTSIYLFFIILERYVMDIGQMQRILDNWNINNKYIIPLLFTMIIANSVFEEVYWRGYIYKKIEDLYNPIKVLILTSLFYASYHLITTINLFSIWYGIIFTLIIFGAGFFWGFMRKKFNSIYFSIISHLLADLGIMLIYVRYFY
jgi:membrane protease YdiL (CAAX protease family)